MHPWITRTRDLEPKGQLVILETDGELCIEPEFATIDRYGIGSEYQLGENVLQPGFRFDKVERILRDRIEARRLAKLPSECAACHVRSICRGGHPGTRYDDRDRSHASAHCTTMYALSLDVAKYLSDNGYEEECLADDLRIGGGLDYYGDR
ncbi:MAG: hypothetical protein ACREXR_18260 [Gammaproteobacteria bacterium]